MTGRTPRGPWRYTLFDMVIATGLITMAWQDHNASDWDFPIGVAMALTLLARRYVPFVVLGIVSSLALAQVFLTANTPTVYDLAVIVAMVAVVSHAAQMWKAYVAGGVVVIGVGVLAADNGLLRWGTDPAALDGMVQNLSIVGVCAAVWLTAYVLRTRRIYVQGLEERAATAERERDHLTELAAADERAAIARELHDVVAHSLAVMIVQADGASYAIEGDRDRARGAVKAIAETGREALEDMRRIVEVLRGTTTPDGEGDRRRIGLDQLEALVEGARSAGLIVDLRIDGDPPALSAAAELTLYRLTQEGLTNALRHAGPGAAVTVELRFSDGTAFLEVIDDGAGKLSAAGHLRDLRPSGGNGLIGMRERVAVHGGQLTAGPRLGAGWQVTAVVPVKAGA
jgi:signal transduction histidine kinase